MKIDYLKKKAQEEMVGFVLIIIMVAVILLILLGFYLNNSSKSQVVESYQVDGFIQSFLQYTTDCQNDLGYLSIQDLIFDCQEGGMCNDGRDSCSALNSTLKDIVDVGWRVGSGRSIQGYELDILVNNVGTLALKDGNVTKNYEGGSQDFSRSGEDYNIAFKAYY